MDDKDGQKETHTKKEKRTVDCILGMQWGSEGKGKIVAYLAKEYDAAVRSGGPQAGHTFYYQETKYINHQVPCTVFNSECMLYLAANAIIAPQVLEDEMKRYHLGPDRLRLDRHAVILTCEHQAREQQSTLTRIASTLQGVGAATADKVMRTAELAGAYAERTHHFEEYITDASRDLERMIILGKHVILEGTQGFGLSLSHGCYPYVTSRDITDAALLSDAGISLRHHRKTIGVMRTYPIRVGGTSGPTGSQELSWDKITTRSGAAERIQEYTTVTHRLRRVFEQDWDILTDAIRVNAISEIALLFIDYINFEDHGKRKLEELSTISRRYIESVEDHLEIPVLFIGTGPKENDIIDVRR